jgi:Escherichia/Staphylococcus phage prohead protease
MPTTHAQHGKCKFDIQIKSIAADGSFEGILASYNTVDLGGDSILPGAFTKTLQERGNVVPLLWQHKSDTPIGDLTLSDSPEGLRFKGRLLLELEDARKAYVLLKARVIKGMSIGYDTIKDSVENSVRQLKELRLWEGSIVTFPMNEEAMVTGVKTVDGRAVETKGDFTQELAQVQLQDAGYQMQCALSYALYSVPWANGMTVQEKKDAIDTICQQFAEAYKTYFAQYIDWMVEAYGDMELMSQLKHEHKSFATSMGRRAKGLKLMHELKAGRKFSAATKKSLGAANDHADAIVEHAKGLSDIFDALFDDEADDDPEELMGAAATPETKAAEIANPEPVTNHSAAVEIVEQMRALYRTA